MQRGCIAVDKIECDSCHRFLNYGERYLLIDDEKGEKKRFCFDCCLARGYVSHREERGEATATFLPEEQI